MWNVPVGRFFEAVIDWLKENLGFLFDLIDTVLGFSIRTLEQLLLLDHSKMYPSVVLAVAAAVVGFFLVAKTSRNLRLVVAATLLVLAGGLELWRYRTLEARMTPEQAAELAGELLDYRADLESVAPSDYGRLLALLADAESVAPEASRFVRNLGRVERRVGRLQPGEFEEAAELAPEVADVFEDDRVEVSMPAELRARVEEVRGFYLALSGIERSERFAARLERQEEPQNRHTVLNERNHRRTLAYLEASLAHAETLGVSAETRARWEELRDRILSLDPAKLRYYPAVAWIVLFSLLAYLAGGAGLAVFSAIGFSLILSMGYWVATMETLALVMAATFFALLVGVPVGIWSARSGVVNQAIRPVLDFMQTMPAFVYLIPAVLFFGLGRVPGAIATLIFAMPPAVRLTALGIRQVPGEVVEAAQAFGATPGQLLFKAQLPIAMPTILAGLNQTIMLALSMVVIGGMIGAGGLGAQVLIGISQMKVAVGFESGIAVVILAIFLDRITQRLGGRRKG